MVKRLCISAPDNLLWPHCMEFIVGGEHFPNLEELIVTHQQCEHMAWTGTGRPCSDRSTMQSRLHVLYKSLMGRGVNVACGDDDGYESHFYLATDLSLLTRALRQPSYGPYGLDISDWDIFVIINLSPRLEHSLPLLVEMVTSKVSQMSKPSRIHLATNHVKISSNMDMESLKKSMMGVTSFTIWRHGDEELTQEEVTAINIMLEMLQQGRGKLTSVSMPKVNLTDIHFTISHIKATYIFLFQGGTSGFRGVGLEVWRGRGGGGGFEV